MAADDVISEVPGIGMAPLAALPDLNAGILAGALKRILPAAPDVPVAAFNSAI